MIGVVDPCTVGGRIVADGDPRQGCLLIIRETASGPAGRIAGDFNIGQGDEAIHENSTAAHRSRVVAHDGVVQVQSAAGPAARYLNTATLDYVAAVLNGKTGYGRIASKAYIEYAVDSTAIDRGDTGAHAGNGQFAGDIQITARRRVLAGACRGQLVVAGTQNDFIRAGQGIGLHYGCAQGGLARNIPSQTVSGTGIDGVVGCVDREGGQNARPILLGAETEGHPGIDLPFRELQHPVATLLGATGEILTGRYIRPGDLSDVLEKVLPGAAGGDVAAIEEDVAITCEGVAPGGDGIDVLIQGSAVQPAAAQSDLPAGAVGDKMQCVNSPPIGQHLADLLHTVASRVQGDDFDPAAIAAVRRKVVQKHLVILDAGIDKYQLFFPGYFRAVLSRIAIRTDGAPDMLRGYRVAVRVGCRFCRIWLKCRWVARVAGIDMNQCGRLYQNIDRFVPCLPVFIQMLPDECRCAGVFKEGNRFLGGVRIDGWLESRCGCGNPCLPRSG